MKFIDLKEENTGVLSKLALHKVYTKVYTNFVNTMDKHSLLKPQVKSNLVSKRKIFYLKTHLRAQSGQFTIPIEPLIYGIALYTDNINDITDVNKLLEVISKTKLSGIVPKLKSVISKNNEDIQIWSWIYALLKESTGEPDIEEYFCQIILGTDLNTALDNLIEEFKNALVPLSEKFGFIIEIDNDHNIILKDNGKNNLGRKKSILQIASEAITTGKYDAVRAKYKIPLGEYIVGLMRAYRQAKSYDIHDQKKLFAWVTKQLGGLK